ncbi:MAG: hypothetical protein ABI333_22855 [bacterium]
MAELVDELLAVAWPEGLPGRWAPLVDRELCEALLRDFKLGVIFPFGGEVRPVRLALSAQGERERWEREVLRAWPSERLEGFLGQVPAETRLMVDSDGSERAVVYLDDLQEVEHELRAPSGMALMSATLGLPGDRLGVLTRHTEPPVERVTGSLRARLEELVGLGAEGLWSLRWEEGRVLSVLWISESRWRGNAEASRAVLGGLGSSRAWAEALRVAERHGRLGYPDAVELLGSGGVDVTLGIL